MSPVELESRIQDLLEGGLAEDRWPELRNELLQSEEARQVYHAYAEMHTLLNQKAHGAHVLSLKTPVNPIDELLKSQRKLAFRYSPSLGTDWTPGATLTSTGQATHWALLPYS